MSSKGDVQDVIEMTMLANKYYEQKVEELKNAVTEEDAEEVPRGITSPASTSPNTRPTRSRTPTGRKTPRGHPPLRSSKKLIVNKMFDSSYNESTSLSLPTRELPTRTRIGPRRTCWRPSCTGTAWMKGTATRYKGAYVRCQAVRGKDRRGQVQDCRLQSGDRAEYRYPEGSLPRSTRRQVVLRRPHRLLRDRCPKWLFDAGRKSGDHTVITTETKSTGKKTVRRRPPSTATGTDRQG